MNRIDQQKAGLQDDHDPRDPAQKQNDEPEKSEGKQQGELQDDDLPNNGINNPT